MSRSNNRKLIVRDDSVEVFLGFAETADIVKNDFCFLVLLRTFGDTNLDRVNDRKGGISVINDFHGIVYAGYDNSGHIRPSVAVHGFRTAAPDEQTTLDGHVVERDFPSAAPQPMMRSPSTVMFWSVTSSVRIRTLPLMSLS